MGRREAERDSREKKFVFHSLIHQSNFSRKRGGDRESRDRVQGRSEGRVHATPV